ncbi:MAG: hypothetical protein GX442_11300 [Candidatus Riflebacteria bacterium]|nr:hypothetical protein [Candidatus Riflebacteria bacterium]
MAFPHARPAFPGAFRWAVPALLMVVALAAAGSTPARAGETEERVRKLIRQVRGEAFYWDRFGQEYGWFASWTTRNFETNGRLAAAHLLGQMGSVASAAVPALIDVLLTGPNDVNTGDGILPLRSMVAKALGEIGDPAAIGPLIDKLKVREPCSLGPGASLGSPLTTPPVGVGHPAIVEALASFGPLARPAIPVLEDLASTTTDAGFRTLVGQALQQIRPAPAAP